MEEETKLEQEKVVEPKAQETPKTSILSSKWLKIGAIIVVLLILLGGAYFLGKNTSTKKGATVTTQVGLTPTPVDETASWKTFATQKLKGNSLDAYSMQYPDSWTLTSSLTSFSDSRTLSKNDYSINVYQAAVGGAGCIFEGTVSDGPMNDYRNLKYVEVKTELGTLRRLIDPGAQKNDGKTIFSFCESNNNKDYGMPTQIGFISYTTPKNPDNAVLSQMDQMLKTIKIIESATPTLSQSFLEIPEYGIKFALSENIKDAYELPETASKGYIYLKVHSLDSEPQCLKDPSSTAALSKVGKDDINEMSGQKYSDAGNGVTIGNYYYFIDLAQYECAESAGGKALLTKVRKEFSEASKTITSL